MNSIGRQKLAQVCNSNSHFYSRTLGRSLRALINDSIVSIKWNVDLVKRNQPEIPWNGSLKGSARMFYKSRIDLVRRRQQLVNMKTKLIFWLCPTKKDSRRHNVYEAVLANWIVS